MKDSHVAPSGNVTEQQVLVIPVAGIRSKTMLLEMAKNLSEEIGRNEMGGAVETRSLASFGGDNSDPDLLTLQTGDAVELVSDIRALSLRASLVSEQTDHVRRPFSEEVAAIAARLGSQDLARVIVATARNAVVELQSFFRVRTVKFDWSGTGIIINFDFQNFIEARQRGGSTPSGANLIPPRKRPTPRVTGARSF